MSVDSKLREWAARRQASQAHLDSLATRTVTEAARRRFVAIEPMPAGSQFLARLGYALTGAIVAGLVIVFGLQRGAPGLAGDEAGGALRQAVPTPGQISTIARLYAETVRLFPRRLRWIAQSNGDMGLGVEATEESWIADAPPMLVRLVIVSRTGRDTAWRPVWSTDVVLRGEDMAEIAPNRNAANKVALWVYPLQNGKVAVDTAVELDKPLRFASRQSAVVTAGQPTPVATVRLGDVEYRLIQTVERMNGRRDHRT